LCKGCVLHGSAIGLEGVRSRTLVLVDVGHIVIRGRALARSSVVSSVPLQYGAFSSRRGVVFLLCCRGFLVRTTRLMLCRSGCVSRCAGLTLAADPEVGLRAVCLPDYLPAFLRTFGGGQGFDLRPGKGCGLWLRGENRCWLALVEEIDSRPARENCERDSKRNGSFAPALRTQAERIQIG